MADNAPTPQQTFPVVSSFAETAHLDAAGYREAYRQAASNPDAYWAKEAERIAWMCLLIVTNAGVTGPVRHGVLATRILRAVLTNRAAEISPRAKALAEVVPLMNNLWSAKARTISRSL